MNTNTLILAIVIGILAFLVLRPLLAGGSRISPAEAAAKVASGEAVLVDVREPDEWASGVAQPAVLLSLGELRGKGPERERFLQDNKDRLIILYCASGMRSGMAAGTLKKEGYRVANLGGFGRWESAGLPVRKP